jgi:hypothetical protein
VQPPAGGMQTNSRPKAVHQSPEQQISCSLQFSFVGLVEYDSAPVSLA